MLLINASNLYVGGGLQAGISVIEEFSALNVTFVAAVSPAVWQQLSVHPRQFCTVIKKTPSGLLNFSSRRQLDNMVLSHHITEVFTIFGPSYWNPKVAEHLTGFALPWLIYNIPIPLKGLSIKERIKKKLLKNIQPVFYKKNTSKIVAETEDVRLRIIEKLHFPATSVFTVSNTLASVFKTPDNYHWDILTMLPVKNDDIWLLTISHDYPHKNLIIIADLLDLLPEHYKFLLTLDESFKNKIAARHHHRLILTGKVTSAQCPPLYEVSDALFLPTLLECFSASYVEAMFMGKPIFTSARRFSATICKEAAFYFDPLNAVSIAETIEQAFLHPAVIQEKCRAGKKVVATIPTAKERAEQYLSILYGKKS